MLRIFRHFFPVPTLLLGLSESVMLTFVLYVISQPLSVVSRGAGLGQAQFSVGFALLAIIAMMAVGLYNSDVFLDYRMASLRAALALGLVVPVAFAATYLFERQFEAGEQIDYYWLTKAMLAWLLCLAVTRTAFVRILSLGLFKRRVLVLGTGERALRLKQLSEDRTRERFVPAAFINACGDTRRVATTILELGDPQDRMRLVKLATTLKAKELVLATDDRRGLPVKQLLECKLLGIGVIDYVAFCERETGRVDLDALQPSWFILSDGFRMGPVSEFVKRSFDLLISSLILLAFLPVMALTAIAIKLESPGPVLFRQERVGLRGRTFMLLKFRSMRVDAEREGTPQWAQQNDPRVTRVGSFIRMVRIDELPQLWNVLRGDMSFVGPRPERPYFVERLAQCMPFYNERHAIRPGITGWAQVNYCYGASIEDARQKLSYDLYYLKNRDLFLDFVTLMQTVRVILWPEGVR
jgi:sugar transferase (PEP-CTERM system associated)